MPPGELGRCGCRRPSTWWGDGDPDWSCVERCSAVGRRGPWPARSGVESRGARPCRTADVRSERAVDVSRGTRRRARHPGGPVTPSVPSSMPRAGAEAVGGRTRVWATARDPSSGAVPRPPGGKASAGRGRAAGGAGLAGLTRGPAAVARSWWTPTVGRLSPSGGSPPRRDREASSHRRGRSGRPPGQGGVARRGPRPGGVSRVGCRPGCWVDDELVADHRRSARRGDGRAGTPSGWWRCGGGPPRLPGSPGSAVRRGERAVAERGGGRPPGLPWGDVSRETSVDVEGSVVLGSRGDQRGSSVPGRTGRGGSTPPSGCHLARSSSVVPGRCPWGSGRARGRNSGEERPSSRPGRHAVRVEWSGE